jgi:hypothetical protein
MSHGMAAVLVLAVAPGLAYGQSLGSAAEKEKDRHRKNEDGGVKARVVTEEDLLRDRPVELPPGTPTPPPKPASAVPPPPRPPASGAKPTSRKEAGRQEPVASVKEALVLPPNTNGGQDLLVQARDRLVWAKKNRDEINSRLAEPLPRPVDETASYEEHDRLTGSPEQLRALLLRVQIEIEVAQRTIETLEAQRSGKSSSTRISQPGAAGSAKATSPRR